MLLYRNLLNFKIYILNLMDIYHESCQIDLFDCSLICSE